MRKCLGHDGGEAEENEDGAVRRRTVEKAHAERELREKAEQEERCP